MAHYICKGGKCNTTSDRPTICLDAACINRYKLLDECNCRDKKSHGKVVTHHGHTERINVVVMGISAGLVVGAYLFFLGLAATYLGWGGSLVFDFADLFVGYDATPIGVAAGTFWGFVEGFVCGALVALIYNYLHRFSR